MPRTYWQPTSFIIFNLFFDILLLATFIFNGNFSLIFFLISTIGSLCFWFSQFPLTAWLNYFSCWKWTSTLRNINIIIIIVGSIFCVSVATVGLTKSGINSICLIFKSAINVTYIQFIYCILTKIKILQNTSLILVINTVWLVILLNWWWLNSFKNCSPFSCNHFSKELIAQI